MTTPTETMTLMLGEMRGQLRELVHGQNNTASKVDALGHELAKISNLPAEIAELRIRVADLEKDRNKRDGAMGFGSWLLSTRFVGWLVGIGALAWAALHGKIDL